MSHEHQDCPDLEEEAEEDSHKEAEDDHDFLRRNTCTGGQLRVSLTVAPLEVCPTVVIEPPLTEHASLTPFCWGLQFQNPE